MCENYSPEMPKTLRREFTGWYSDEIDDLCLYKTKEELEKRDCLADTQSLTILLEEFDGKKIKITVEVLEE